MADEKRDKSLLPLSGKHQGDKQAVKTTIVGGQPPGNDRAMQPVPVGIEQLMAMAAVDPDFAEALYVDQESAVAASGVELTATERGILAATPEPALRQMVGNVGGAIPDEERRAFLGRSAAALLALVGGVLPLGASGCDQKVKGIQPDKPPPNVPDQPKTKAVKPPPEPMPPTGIRPDRPPKPATVPDAGRPAPEPAAPIGGLTAPKKPPVRPQSRGNRPDRPRPRPDRRTKGIRPDRPGEAMNPFSDDEDK